jgi:NAD(P)H-nitrite reductase large subunit
VSFSDIADALDNMKSFDSVLSAFEDVQKVTHCSTGCGGCYQKVLDIISAEMMG